MKYKDEAIDTNQSVALMMAKVSIATDITQAIT